MPAIAPTDATARVARTPITPPSSPAVPARASPHGGPASGSTPKAVVNQALLTHSTRADPTLRITRDARTAPASPPTPDTEVTTPTATGPAPRSRTRKSTNRAVVIDENTSECPPLTSTARMIRSLQVNRRPSPIWARSDLRGAGGRAGSGVRIQARVATLTRYDAASAATAPAGPTSDANPPPRPDPPISATACVVCSLPLPSTSCSRETSVGR